MATSSLPATGLRARLLAISTLAEPGQAGVASGFLDGDLPAGGVVPPADLAPVPDLCAKQRKQWWLATGTSAVLALLVINAWLGFGAPPGPAQMFFTAGAFMLGLSIPSIWEILAWWGLEQPARPELLAYLVELLEHDPETAAIARHLWQAQGRQILHSQAVALTSRATRAILPAEVA